MQHAIQEPNRTRAVSFRSVQPNKHFDTHNPRALPRATCSLPRWRSIIAAIGHDDKALRDLFRLVLRLCIHLKVELEVIGPDLDPPAVLKWRNSSGEVRRRHKCAPISGNRTSPRTFSKEIRLRSVVTCQLNSGPQFSKQPEINRDSKRIKLENLRGLASDKSLV